MAQVISLNGDARRKIDGEPLWRLIKVGEKLGPGDSVFTGDDSELEIHFTKENALHLKSNTLITLVSALNEEKEKDSFFNFNWKRGHLNLKAQPKSRWSFNYKNENLSIKSVMPSQTQLNWDGDSELNIKILSGEAMAYSHEGFFNLNAKKPQMDIKPRFSAGEAHLGLLTHSIEAAKKRKRALASVSEKSEVSPGSRLPPLKTEPINRQIASSTLKEDANTDVKGPGESPQAQLPFNESTIVLRKGAPLNVRFLWLPFPASKNKVLIEIASSNNFQPLLVQKRVQGTGIDLVLPSVGKFFWRLRGDSRAINSPWSETHSFLLETASE